MRAVNSRTQQIQGAALVGPRTGLRVALLSALIVANLCPADATAATRSKRVAAANAAKENAELAAYGRRDDVLRFADEVAARGVLPLGWVEAQLARARYVPSVAKLIAPPPAGSAKNWAAYRTRFVERERIAAGVAFWRANADAFARAEDTFGVPAAIVAGVIGVETYYGRVMGDFRVIDALATLAFDFPTTRRDRSAFFRDELEQLLLLSHREGLDPVALKGSYAGALGLAQFMPGSINRHAIDFDGDGRVDLASSAADAIGSAANYLANFGWQRGMPTHYSVAVPVEVVDRAVLLAPDILPTFTAAEFAERGAVLDPAGRAHEGAMALVELQNGDAAPSYVAGTRNFYTITRYNWSSYYAMAVIELGEAVARAWREAGAR